MQLDKQTHELKMQQERHAALLPIEVEERKMQLEERKAALEQQAHMRAIYGSRGL